MSHYVDDEKLYHHGIGSAGIAAIKDLAFQLHCSEIDGNRRVMGKVPDKNAEENKLKAFYNKNGFMQNPENDHIVFDMEKYEYIDVIK